jgi:hypothetical protein
MRRDGAKLARILKKRNKNLAGNAGTLVQLSGPTNPSGTVAASLKRTSSSPHGAESRSGSAALPDFHVRNWHIFKLKSGSLPLI